MMSDFKHTQSLKSGNFDNGTPLSPGQSLLDVDENLGPNIREHPLFTMGLTPINKMSQFEKLLPPVDDHQNALEPLMKKQFNLFSGHIQI